ncbi:MAG: SurA N-terminal domain-containing protein [Deltaproteobacteria bacterium]|nr:SurA N-terminal domain-containing protein [Deltaproteobacteria bacterium]RLC12651.1 MAG: hypothetical protein DRH43_00950 [Deltaproteobacteria bacterium]
MLSLMRKHAGSWLIKLALGAIVIVFIFWGVGSYRAQRENRVAVVNGAVISLDEYRAVYDQLIQQYREQFGDSLDENLIKTLGLKKKALDELIDRELLLQEANRLGLRVTKEELARAIQQVPAFQRNGHFDQMQYERILAYNRMSPETYEARKAQALIMERIQALILSCIKVSDAEALETFKWREKQVSFKYVLFKPSSYQDVKPTPEEVKTYFSKNKERYEIPPKVKVRYVTFPFKEFESKANISEEEISQYFELNKEQYATPKKVRAQHILFKVPQDAKQEVIDSVRKKALKVLKEARAGADFATLARKYSDDPGSKKKGGDLGFFTRDRMVKPFSDAAFALAPGKISEPVRTRFGWHLIKVTAVQEAKEPVLAEVSDKIRRKLVKDAARTLAYDRANEIYDACYAAGRIDSVAEAYKLNVHETPFFARTESVPGIAMTEEFARTAFDLEENEISEPLELSDGYYILEKIDQKPSTIPELKAVENRVRKDLIRDRQQELASNDAEDFLNCLKAGEEFEKEAGKRKLKVKTTDFFKRFGPIPGIGFEQELINAAFSLTPSKPLADTVIKGNEGYYVICLKERKAPEEKEFEANKSEIKSRLMLQKRQECMEQWLAGLRRHSDISIEKHFLE